MGVRLSSLKSESNYMENKKTPRVVLADRLIKDRSIITLNGEVIRNTPEEPTAVEDYLRSKRR